MKHRLMSGLLAALMAVTAVSGFEPTDDGSGGKSFTLKNPISRGLICRATIT